jgi:hypothetical protein
VRPAPRYRQASQPALNRSREYPLALVTGTVLYDGGHLFGLTEQMHAMSFGPIVGISPADAGTLAVEDGARVTVVSPKAAVYFRDIYDNLYRIVDASYSYQDMTQGTLDAYLSAINNRLNETMKRLTVRAIFAALTVITGIYGMNFEHMPSC